MSNDKRQNPIVTAMQMLRALVNLIRELTATLLLLAAAVAIIYLLAQGNPQQVLQQVAEILQQLGEIPQ